jgi:hypothetical protein
LIFQPTKIPTTQPIKKARRSNVVLSIIFGLDIEFSFNVVLNQTVLDHRDQIPTAIFGHDEPYWASTPTTGLQEVGIETSVIFVKSIEGHQGP